MTEKKSILIISYYYPPMNNGGIQRILNFKKYLPQFGYDVFILTTNSYGLTEQYEEKVFRFSDTGYDYVQNMSHNKIKRTLFRIMRRIQVESGIIIDGKYYWKKEVFKGIEEIIKKYRFNYILASYPTPVNLEIGEYIHDKYKISLIVDYRDGLMYEPFPEIQKSFYVFKKRLLALEERMAQKATFQLAVNKKMCEYYNKKYPQIKTILIPNGFDDNEKFEDKPVELPEGINMLYTGRIGMSRKNYSFKELEDLLKYIFKLGKGINFVFIGEYEKNEVRLFEKYKNVYVYPKVDRAVVVATQKRADALLLISGTQGGTSGKLYEYLFAKKPILNIGGKNEVGEIINGEYFGSTYLINQKKEIGEFLDKLQKGKLNYKYGDLKQYSRKEQCRKLATFMNHNHEY